MISKSDYLAAKKLIKDYESQEFKLLHWKVVIEAWIDRHLHHKKTKPTISPMASKHLKEIGLNLYERAKERGSHEWTEDYCRYVLSAFFDLSYKVDWLKDKYVLHLINPNFDIIINYGKSTPAKKQTGSAVSDNTAITALSFFND